MGVLRGAGGRVTSPRLASGGDVVGGGVGSDGAQRNCVRDKPNIVSFQYLFIILYVMYIMHKIRSRSRG